MPNLRFV